MLITILEIGARDAKDISDRALYNIPCFVCGDDIPVFVSEYGSLFHWIEACISPFKIRSRDN